MFKQLLQAIIDRIHPYENLDKPVTQGEANEIISYINALEARLSALEKKTETILIVKDKFNEEHPVERLSEETAPKCNCMVVNDKRLCPQHDAVITNDHKC